MDAARLSGAKLRVFVHNDLNDLEKILKWVRSQIANRRSQILVVTESIFSMDGDTAPLGEMIALKNKYGAWLMVDEAHATGIIGKNGRGLASELGGGGEIEIQMGTLGKALGASGGYIAGSRTLIDFLINRARSFIFSTAPAPAAAAAATAAIQLAQAAEGQSRRKRLWQLAGRLNSKLKNKKIKFVSAIIPILIGDEKKAAEAAASLREKNIFVPAIRYPSVARSAARLRVTLTAAHAETDVSELLRALKQLNLPN